MLPLDDLLCGVFQILCNNVGLSPDILGDEMLFVCYEGGLEAVEGER